jgi:hypothetical protein
MTGKTRNQNDMPDVPEMDFKDALAEMWSGLSYAAYHMAYVRVYSQAVALQTPVDQLRKQEQAIKEWDQNDALICRAYLAAFFWQLDRFFEGLRLAIARGKKEHSDLKYFWHYEKRMEEIEKTAIRREITAYRNKNHETPAIIGCAWDKKGNFIHHFLPSITGHEQKESIYMNLQLQKYFEFVSDVWLNFAPSELRDRFPRSFKFPVTIPNFFLGELPPKLKGLPRLEVFIEAQPSKGSPAVKSSQTAQNC